MRVWSRLGCSVVVYRLVWRRFVVLFVCVGEVVGHMFFFCWGYGHLGYSIGVWGVVMLVGDMVVGRRHMHIGNWGTCTWGTVLGGG